MKLFVWPALLQHSKNTFSPPNKGLKRDMRLLPFPHTHIQYMYVFSWKNRSPKHGLYHLSFWEIMVLEKVDFFKQLVMSGWLAIKLVASAQFWMVWRSILLLFHPLTLACLPQNAAAASSPRVGVNCEQKKRIWVEWAKNEKKKKERIKGPFFHR